MRSGIGRVLTALLVALMLAVSRLEPGPKSGQLIRRRSREQRRLRRSRPQAPRSPRRERLAAFSVGSLRTQQSLQAELVTGVKNLKAGNALAGAVLLAAMSFIYGVVHAVGPGHGKTIISSYVVANEETVRRGVIISFIAAALQALSAIALVGILAFALNASGLKINAWANQLETVSYALIALVGAWLLTTQLVRLLRRWQELACDGSRTRPPRRGQPPSSP